MYVLQCSVAVAVQPAKDQHVKLLSVGSQGLGASYEYFIANLLWHYDLC